MDRRIESAPKGFKLVSEEKLTALPRSHCGRGFESDLFSRKAEWMVKQGRGHERELALVFAGGCEECFRAFLEWPFDHQAKVLNATSLSYVSVRQEVAKDGLESLFTITLKPEPVAT
jgi:hypothetical protein